MARIDGHDEAFRRLTEEARRADLARRTEAAAARAAELAAELHKALDPGNPSAEDTARILVEANRLPREAQRAFFAVAAGEGSAAADPAEPLRRRIAEGFPERTEKRLSLGESLARHQGAEPRQM